MERTKSIDEQVMDIFDKEYQKLRGKVFEQVEDLWNENDVKELDGKVLGEVMDEYECYYTELISGQLKGAGISPKELERFNPIPH
jgi:hypothetical protein